MQLSRIDEDDESVVGVPLVTTSFACVKDSASFICRPELLGVVSHFLLSATLARVLDDGRSL